MEGVLAIILEPSGILYRNQTCGHGCLEPFAGGILVPFNNDAPIEDTERRLDLQLANKLFIVASLNHQHADEIDDILEKCGFYNVKVDRQKFWESHETWLFVDIEEGDDVYFHKGFGKCKAILTRPNSD